MSAIGIIIGREFRERVMKKSFIISTILTPLLMVGIMVGTSFIMATNVGEAKHIAVVDRSGVIAPSLTSTEVIVYEPTDRTPEELRAESDEQMYVMLAAKLTRRDQLLFVKILCSRTGVELHSPQIHLVCTAVDGGAQGFKAPCGGKQQCHYRYAISPIRRPP
jgi:hypothetical protein